MKKSIFVLALVGSVHTQAAFYNAETLHQEMQKDDSVSTITSLAYVAGVYDALRTTNSLCNEPLPLDKVYTSIQNWLAHPSNEKYRVLAAPEAIKMAITEQIPCKK